MPTPPSRRRTFFAISLGCLASAAACGIAIRRDYSTIPAGQVGFDDLCGLQDYFDTLEAKLASPPALVSAIDIENQGDARIQGGKNRFAFETEFQLKHLRRVLDENWSRLPETLPKAERIEIEVHWSAKAGVQRVVTDGDAEVFIGNQSFALPYHVCLSELLFGAPLYKQRREIEGRPLPYKAMFVEGGTNLRPADAGATELAPLVVPISAPATTPTPPTPTPTAGTAPAATPTPTPAGRAGGPDAGAIAPAPPLFKPAPAAH
jgi:hypothetical protein